MFTNSEDALDTDAKTSVTAAMYEIENHYHESYVQNDMLYVITDENEEDKYLGPVFKGSVRTRPIMMWLGY